MAKTFRGGVHPHEEKELSCHKVFEEMPAPKEVVIPISQHIGRPAEVLVKKKDEVKVGTLLAKSSAFISANIHSPVSGTVKSVGIMENVGGRPQIAVIISNDGEMETEYMEALNPETVTVEQIIERVKEAGIVGQGGAAFPTNVKLSPPPDKKVDCIILNGCECEPYLTRDDRFMLDRTDDLMKGLTLLMKALNVKDGRIGVEDNKPEAIKILTETAKKYQAISIDAVKTKYPQGAEKMLIKAAVNRSVPPGKLPMDVGCVIQNIGTALAVYDAVAKGIPAITCAMTVSGKGIKEPKNLIVPIGTSLSEIIDFCGGMTQDVSKLVVGGPMMGAVQHDLSATVQKATSGLLLLTEKEVGNVEETACLRCGNCVSVCPINLMPTNLMKYAQKERPEEAIEYGIWNCMECGTCQYVCPANIPLVQWLRLSKLQARKVDS
jgi:electron transport complex protein RnfC